MKIFDEENRYLLGQGRYEKYAQRNEGTLWTAYQAATYWSSHPEYGGKEGSKAHTTKVTREDQVKKMLNSTRCGRNLKHVNYKEKFR